MHDKNKAAGQVQLWKQRFEEKEREVVDVVESYETQFESVSGLVENLKNQVRSVEEARQEEVKVSTSERAQKELTAAAH